MGPHRALKNFQILQELSPERGDAMFLARGNTENVVAIKVLAAQALSEEQRSALSKEASLGARLSHEAVLQARALLVEDDFAALVTEFVPGVSLQRLLRFAAGRGVRLPDVCSWYVLERVLAAVASAHALKNGPVIHRGISASSVVVGWDGTVKIGDFGLTQMRRIVARGPSTPARERDLALLMTPEEARGDRPDARSDVFCVALLAIQLATGRTPYSRFRDSAAERILAMSEGNLARLAQTRPDLPSDLRDPIDAALEPDREKRTVTAEKLLASVRAHVDIDEGRAALVKLLDRWRAPLEASVTPWERRASIPDQAPEAAIALMSPGTLALAAADERPSVAALIGGEAEQGEPWQRDGMPVEERALSPTDPVTSLSRVGSTAPDALVMPLPAMRITMPELPTYGGPAVNVPRPAPKRGVFSGGVAAAVIATMFVVLIGGSVILFRWLMGPG